ncbi:MAG: sensor domain-containing diguanylate cyclase [Deltaproteobacteria bacterium]|nr:sensor domain-containing diguanylate cyclase [Deltaproteobacteria bacterium]
MLTKKQLIQEVAELRKHITGLEARIKDCSRLEASLRESEERFRFMAKTTGDVLYRLKYSSMKYDYISPSILELTGYSPEEIDAIGLSTLIMKFESLGENILSIADAVRNRQERKTGQYLVDYLIRTKSGGSRWLGDHSFPWLDESGNLIGSVGILSDISERKRAEAALRQMNQNLHLLATLDGLTGVANRRRFDEFISREWGRMQREQAPISLILCDIDFFKLYNDTNGHQAGDDCLREVARAIRKSVKLYNDTYGHQAGDDCLREVARTIRKSVNRPSDLVARYGGEEFAVVLSNTDAGGAVNIAENIRREVEALSITHHQHSGGRILTISCGIASMIPVEDYTLDSLIALADKGLYEAKKQGRNRGILKTGTS